MSCCGRSKSCRESSWVGVFGLISRDARLPAQHVCRGAAQRALVTTALASEEAS